MHYKQLLIALLWLAATCTVSSAIATNNNISSLLKANSPKINMCGLNTTCTVGTSMEVIFLAHPPVATVKCHFWSSRKDKQVSAIQVVGVPGFYPIPFRYYNIDYSGVDVDITGVVTNLYGIYGVGAFLVGTLPANSNSKLLTIRCTQP